MEIKDRLNKVILSFTQFENDDVILMEDTDLVLNLGFTSIKFVQLFMALEEEFEISLSNSFFCDENSRKYKYLLDIVNSSIGDN